MSGDLAAALDRRIQSRELLVGVVGLGYVGLPLARQFHDAGFGVLGFDIDVDRVSGLNQGRNPIQHFGPEFVEQMRVGGRFEATADFDRLDEPDVILICVPTPLGEHREPDLSFVEATCAAVAGACRPGQLVCLESTTWPGTTREVVAPRLEASGLTVGDELFVAYAPEREDPGRGVAPREVPKLVAGLESRSTRLAAALYATVVDEVVVVESPEVAEAAKLLENIYRAVNIALINELKTVLTAMDIDVWSVVEAASTKPFGFMPFYPGPGPGGHCIPVDPWYLSWRARQFGVSSRFVELAGEVNDRMPAWVVQRVVLALNDGSRAVRGSRLLVVGIAYKADVDDLRESPALLVIEQLQALGAQVDYHDPHVPRIPPLRRHALDMASVALEPERLAAYDAVVVVTDHRACDWAAVAEHARLVIDTRNVMRGIEAPNAVIVSA